MATKRTANNGITAIYVRRSVSDKDKGNNSLSIAAQKEECVRFVGDCEYRIYCDDGKSGKDIAHRPEFQAMMLDARDGLISRIVVKKYDRFSRNMREYLNITDELDRYGVTVYSLSEPFNTETKEGRMMRNNLLNFAEFERETIAARVADAFQTKARETGFYQGGKMYYGFNSERRTVNGKTGSVLVPSAQAESVRIAYEMYQNPDVSLIQIIRYFQEHGIDTARPIRVGSDKTGNMDRSHLSRILESPLYVRADKEVYAYFSSKGYEMLDPIEDYDGIHGIFYHKTADGISIKLAYHEGLVPAEVWLKVQDKKSHNSKFLNNGTAMNSWLVGMMKCGNCGYALHINHRVGTKGQHYRFFYDYGRRTMNGCPHDYTIEIKPDQVEDIVFKEMCKRVDQLVIAKKESTQPDPDSESVRTEIIKVDDEINKLMSRLADADDVLFGYIQDRVSKLHEQKSALERKLQTKTRKRKAIDTKPLEEPLKMWDSLTVQEKHNIAVMMIDVVYVSDENGVEVVFSI
ncbi:MAG: recombinase family protein [Oscillospiraceae bacterium]|nr:recombinase family protein [Oscillospiraceae bacterium]